MEKEKKKKVVDCLIDDIKSAGQKGLFASSLIPKDERLQIARAFADHPVLFLEECPINQDDSDEYFFHVVDMYDEKSSEQKGYFAECGITPENYWSGWLFMHPEFYSGKQELEFWSILDKELIAGEDIVIFMLHARRKIAERRRTFEGYTKWALEPNVEYHLERDLLMVPSTGREYCLLTKNLAFACLKGVVSARDKTASQDGILTRFRRYKDNWSTIGDSSTAIADSVRNFNKKLPTELGITYPLLEMSANKSVSLTKIAHKKLIMR